MDEIDRAVINALRENGRRPNKDLADAVGLSPSACLRRVQNLEALGVIRGYRAVVDAEAMGVGFTAFVRITLERQSDEQLRAFEGAVVKCRNVLMCFLMAGEADYLLRVVARDLADFERIHKTVLSKLPGVARIQSSFALREVADRDVAWAPS